MVRCDEFYEQVEKVGNFCGMSQSSYYAVKQYIDFIRAPEHSEISE